jgi:hypothetical protein
VPDAADFFVSYQRRFSLSAHAVADDGTPRMIFGCLERAVTVHVRERIGITTVCESCTASRCSQWSDSPASRVAQRAMMTFANLR